MQGRQSRTFFFCSTNISQGGDRTFNLREDNRCFMLELAGENQKLGISIQESQTWPIMVDKVPLNLRFIVLVGGTDS